MRLSVLLGLFAFLEMQCFAVRQSRVYYVSNLLGSFNNNGDLMSPWTVAGFQAFLAINGAVPGDSFLFNADEVFMVSSSTVLNITGVVGTAAMPVQFASYGNNSAASFVYSTNATQHAVVITQSQFVVMSSLSFDMNGFTSSGDAFKLSCVFSIWLNSTTVSGAFVSAVAGKLSSGCGVDTLQIAGCVFTGMLKAGVMMIGNSTVNTDPSSPDLYDHQNIQIYNTYIGDTGSLASANFTTGACVEFTSVSSFQMWSNSLIRCGANNGRAGFAPDFIHLTRVRWITIAWNILRDSGNSPTGFVNGNNGIRISAACYDGQIDHNEFVSLAGSGIVFEAYVPGVEVDQWDRRFIDSWTIGYNLFENAGSYFGRSVVALLASTSCSSLCFRNVRFVHNTLFVRPSQQSHYSSAFAVVAPTNASSLFSVVNNVFYILNTSSFISWSSPPASLVLVANVYATDASGAVLLGISSLGFRSLLELQSAGYEQLTGTPYGVVVPLNASLTARLGMLPDPTADIDLVFGDPVNGGTAPLTNGDRINGVGFAVDIGGNPLDPLFHAPGHERALVQPYFVNLIDAYHPWRFSPALGAGVPLGLVFSPDVVASLGVFDVMSRFNADVSRASVDPGAVRFMSTVTMIPGFDVSLASGRWWLLDVVMTVDTDLTLPAGCNVTVEQGFDVPSLANLDLLPGSNLTLLDGSTDIASDGSITLEQNSSMNFDGLLKVQDGGTLSIQGGNFRIDKLLLSSRANLAFLSSGRAITIDKGVHFQGTLVLYLSSPPPANRARDTVVVTVATFPFGASNGSFSNITVVPVFSSSCTYSGQGVTSGSTLGVLVSTSSCQQLPIAVGVIVGIAVGCFVGACVLVGVGLWLLRRQKIKQAHRAFVKAQAERLQANSDIQLMRLSIAERVE
jgi:hypothetical protein